MDHKYIDELDIVDRYLMGKLPVAESARFEEHFVDCLECTDRLETTKAFVEGLRLVASERAPEARTNIPKGRVWYLRDTVSRRSFVLAAGVLSLVVFASAVLVFNQIRRSRAEADQARSSSTQWERRYEEERQLSAAASREHQESERELTEQVAQLRTELDNERKLESHDNVQVNLPILVLNSTRGSEPLSGSINELTLPRSSASFLISLAPEGETGYRDYLMTILGSQNQLIWKSRGIKPNRYNLVSVLFNSTLFRPGDYNLTVEGVAGDGSASVVGKYSFRVLKTP
jgi:hypothetical protein